MPLEPLPEGTVLLHVGPHKTGTTALQFAASRRRKLLAKQGVTYPGRGVHHTRAANAVGERVFGWRERGGRAPDPEKWTTLVEQTRAATGRVLISSEFFGELETRYIERVVRDLGPDRVHVVVTLRPLTKILPSSWQQYLKGGTARPLASWLDAVLADPPRHDVTPTFWQRQDHGALVERWVGVLGAEKVTVVVLDSTNHAMLPNTFEDLLGLERGLLAPADGQRVNRSMTAAECELLRRTNKVVARQDVEWPDYARVVRNAAVVRMVEARKPDPDEARVELPHWAKVRANDFGADAVRRISATGARVVGDLAWMTPDPGPAPDGEVDRADAAATDEQPTSIPLDAAVEALVGSVSGSLAGDAYFASERRKRPAPITPHMATAIDPTLGPVGDLPLRDVSTRELAGVLRRRLVRAARRQLPGTH